MKKMSKELIGVGVTVARLGVAEWVARRVRDGKPIAAPMAGLIAADILDGALLRKLDMDTPTRRVADGVVDQLSMGRVALEVGKKYPKSRKYIAALALRAVGVGAANGVHFLRRVKSRRDARNKRSRTWPVRHSPSLRVRVTIEPLRQPVSRQRPSPPRPHRPTLWELVKETTECSESCSGVSKYILINDKYLVTMYP